MRHHNSNRKFGRERNQRRALLKTLAVSLIRDEKITTSEAKAKELRPFVEKLVTKAKINGIATRRLLSSRIGVPETVKKLVDVIGPKYASRSGGYTRIVKLPARASDASKRAIIEFV